MIDRKAYRFFRDHAGYIVGRRAMCAFDLARAEAEAARRDWAFCWEWDEYADASFVETWSQREQDEWNSRDHEVLTCVVRDSEGNVLASLGGIFDPDPNYSRVIEAELASQALWEEDQATRYMAV